MHVPLDQFQARFATKGIDWQTSQASFELLNDTLCGFVHLEERRRCLNKSTGRESPASQAGFGAAALSIYHCDTELSEETQIKQNLQQPWPFPKSIHGLLPTAPEPFRNVEGLSCGARVIGEHVHWNNWASGIFLHLTVPTSPSGQSSGDQLPVYSWSLQITVW